MYDKVPTSMNFVEREKKVEKFWEENHIFEKSIDNRKRMRAYSQSQNHLLHIFHILSYVFPVTGESRQDLLVFNPETPK